MRTNEVNQDTARIHAAVFGSIVGDALGVPVEFMRRESLREAPVVGMRAYGTHRQPAGTWSDDTSLMLCLAESRTEAGGIDFHDQSSRFVSWMRDAHWTPHGDVFDIGNATREAILRLSAGIEPTDAGPSGEFHCGNGSLMRILPIGLYLAYADRQERAETASLCSRLTHGHPRLRYGLAPLRQHPHGWLPGGSVRRLGPADRLRHRPRNLPGARHPGRRGGCSPRLVAVCGWPVTVCIWGRSPIAPS